jgi:outer membrane receptor protein involved in Fe transport
MIFGIPALVALALMLGISLSVMGPAAWAEDPVPQSGPSEATPQPQDSIEKTPAPPSDAPTSQPQNQSPNDITVHEKRPATAASQLSVPAADVEDQPINRPADLLQAAPGLFTTYPGGGGKASQLLLRGFDSDHGTDVAIFVDQLPVNLRSNAHGQGYADLFWLIPETVERIDISKGPYYANIGDFDTAGAVNFVPYERLSESVAKLEIGQFNTQRYLVMGSPRTGLFGGEDPEMSAILAVEGDVTNGPFRNPEDFDSYKLYGRFSAKLSDTQKLTLWSSWYSGSWNASGEIPLRAVEDGAISRWGSIDPSQGGESQRFNLLLRDTWSPSPNQRVEATAWVSEYKLNLDSDFTFFLNNPVGGDGIAQLDRRWLYGGEIAYHGRFDEGIVPVALSAGLQLRTDDARVSVGNQTQREITSLTESNDIYESSLAPYLQAEIFLAPWARSVLGLRVEQFWFNVSNRLPGPGGSSGYTHASLVLPKASLILRPFASEAPFSAGFQPLTDTELFLNYGEGYHSNDARVVTCHVPTEGCDPSLQTLPVAVGEEVGVRTHFGSFVNLSASYWWLQLQEELVFDPDTGTDEVRPRSHRQGVEVETQAHLLEWLTSDLQFTYSTAVLGKNGYVDQAPIWTLATGLTARHPSGVTANLHLRSLGRRYGVAGNQVALLHGYAVADLLLRYRWRHLELSFGIENLTNENYASTELYYISRLPGEPPSGVLDYHFTPGYHRNVSVGLAAYF